MLKCDLMLLKLCEFENWCFGGCVGIGGCVGVLKKKLNNFWKGDCVVVGGLVVGYLYYLYILFLIY